MLNSNITEISVFLNSDNNEYFLSIHVKAHAQNYSCTFPMRPISLNNLVELHTQQADGIIYKRNGQLFYGDVPKIIEIDEIHFNLSKESFKCLCTVAYMSQLQIFYKTYPDIRLSFSTSSDGTPSLTTTTKFVKKEFIDIIREGNDNPNKSQKEHLYERIVEVWDEVENYQMRKVSAEELMKLRLSKIPGAVYKKDGTLFYVSIPNTLNLNTDFDRTLERHVCGEHCSRVCNGCPRTSDFTVASQLKYGKTFAKAVADSWRIEKYPFVLEGIESFNMGSTSEAFRVLRCDNYKTRYKGSPSSKRPSKETKLSLAHLYWDDFHGDYSEMRARIKSQTK